MTGDKSPPSSDTSDVEVAGKTKEDPQTSAARKELKQTSISENTRRQSLDSDRVSSGEEDQSNSKASRFKTPDKPTSQSHTSTHGTPKEVRSPKKKRAHDQVEKSQEEEESGADDSASSSSRSSPKGSRLNRSEPEKKRARDQEALEKTKDDGGGEETKAADGKETTPSGSSSPKKTSTPQTMMTTMPNTTTTTTTTTTTIISKSSQPQAPAKVFSASGFGKLATSASPMATFAAGSCLNSGSSPFATFCVAAPPTTSAPAPVPKLTFWGSSASSPFATAGLGAGSAFGSGGGFGSALAGPRLTSFAKPGEVLKTDKQVKPFGAPESDSEEDSGDNDDDADAGEDKSREETPKEDKADEDAKVDDKKKPKLQRVVVDDGEAGEVTLLTVRAKLYQLEKPAGWKERGAGMLKVNAPEECVSYDHSGMPIASSFDASPLKMKADDSQPSKVVRLLMRQDHTLRVILNTAMLPSMDFQCTEGLKATNILFTAFDGGEAKFIQMRMSKANADAVMKMMADIKMELKEN